jgi:pSer/pThr/pTyr-binding forkhead associated (FHA) protein
MDPVSSDLYDLGAWAGELQQLFSLAATGGSLPAHQQSVANQARAAVEAIDAGAPPADPEAMVEWVGARCGESLTVVHPSGMMTAIVSLGQVSSIHLAPSGAPEWHIIFRAGFESLEAMAELSAEDEMVELPELSVRISDGAETISDCSFMADGTARDERDWQGKLELAADQIEARLQSVPEADDLDGELMPGVGEGIEEGDAAPDALAGDDAGALGAMGRRLVRGAVAGAAGLAAARAARAAKERRPKKAEPAPPPAATPPEPAHEVAALPVVDEEPVVWEAAGDRAAPDHEAAAEPEAPAPDAGPSSWYYVRDGQRVGPVSEPELQQLMNEGELGPQSYIRRESMVDWQRAADVPELGAEQQSPDQVPAATAEGPALVYLEGEHQGEKLPLGTTTRIGRSDKNDILLADPTVSSRHAVIEVTTHGLRLSDVGSTNGTYVNQKKINLPTDLKHEDMVTFGAVKMQLVLPEDAAAPGGTVMMPLPAQPTPAPPQPKPPQPALPSAPVAGATPDPRSCTRCGEAIAGGVKFCGACGEPVAEPAEPQSAAPPVAPRSCSRCGQPVADGLKFCTACGGPVAEPDRRSCQHCGREVTGEDSFCPGCGRPLATQAAAEPAFCTGCGAQLGSGDRFCGKCGKPVGGGAG